TVSVVGIMPRGFIIPSFWGGVISCNRSALPVGKRERTLIIYLHSPASNLEDSLNRPRKALLTWSLIIIKTNHQTAKTPTVFGLNRFSAQCLMTSAERLCGSPSAWLVLSC